MNDLTPNPSRSSQIYLKIFVWEMRKGLFSLIVWL